MTPRTKFNLISILLRYLIFVTLIYIVFLIDNSSIERIKSLTYIVVFFAFVWLIYISTYISSRVKCPNCKYKIGSNGNEKLKGYRLFSPKKCPNCGYDLTKDEKDFQENSDLKK